MDRMKERGGWYNGGRGGGKSGWDDGGDEEIWTAVCSITMVDVRNICKCATCSGTGSQLKRSGSSPPRRSHSPSCASHPP